MAGYKKSVYKSFALIMQLGISMMVPIALCVALGLWLDRLFGTSWIFIPLMILGMAAGVRNMYRLAMAASRDDEPEQEKKDEHDEAE